MRRFLIFLTILTLSAMGLFAGEMTLKECLVRALSANLDISIQQLDTRVAEQRMVSSKGIFDPTIQLDVNHRATASPSTWQIEGALISKTDYSTGQASVSQLLPTGGSVSFSLDSAKNDSNSIWYTVNPSYNSTLSLGLSHSLLKGFGSDITRYQITLYRNSYGAAAEQLRQQIMNTVLDVEKAYWDLHYAYANLDVKKKTLKLARDLLEDTQKRIDLGTQAPIEIYSAQVGVATREEEIITARNLVESAQDNIKKLLNVQSVEEWEAPVIPAEKIAVEKTEFDLNESFQAAMELRPDVRIMVLDRATKNLDYIVAKNNLLPTLDMNFNYWYDGSNLVVEVDPVTGEPAAVAGELSDALDQVTNRDYKNWSAALTFRMPLGNREARGDREVARLNVEKSERKMEQLKQTVFLGVREALRNLETAKKSLDAARASRILAEKSLDAERKKYENGMSTPFQVLEVEADLSEAETREVRALIHYRKTLAEYHWAVGDILSFEGIELDEPDPVKKSVMEKTPVLSYGWWIRKDDTLK